LALVLYVVFFRIKTYSTDEVILEKIKVPHTVSARRRRSKYFLSDTLEEMPQVVKYTYYD
jgi:hypothetical protein